MEKKYLISEAAKEVHVENHVLRYWEDELGLPIKRNELGHRYYTNEDVEQFKQIKILKDKGLQLKAIKLVLKGDQTMSATVVMQEMGKTVNGSAESAAAIKKTEQPAVISGGEMILSPDKEQKLERLQELLQNMMLQAVEKSNHELAENLKDFFAKEMDYQLRSSEERQEENWRKEEEYFQKLDELIRKKGAGKNSTAEKKERWKIFQRKEIKEVKA